MNRFKVISAIFAISISLMQIVPVNAKTIKIPRNINIISRQQWGADEKITFLSKEEAAKVLANSGELYLDELSLIEAQDPEIEKIVTTDPNGATYKWPLEYAKKIEFIVMHYTGMTNELPDDPILEMQDIFQSHTLFKGWGDIGYHYVIDRNGKVYEGRKGGPKVIGGHARPVNKVSIGISLMGNYNDQELTAPMLASVIALLEKLTKENKINPLGSTEYKEKKYQNIHGHSDNSAKIDPGKNFNQKFQAIRKLVTYYRYKKPTAVPSNLDFTTIGDHEMIGGVQGEPTAFDLHIKNNGSTTWVGGTFLENNSEPKLPTVFAKLENNEVLPGGLGTFSGIIPAGEETGLKVPNISLVINNTLRPVKTIPFPVMIEPKEKPVRVAISFKNFKPQIRSEAGMSLYSGKKLVYKFAKNEIVTVAMLKNGKYRVRTDKKHFDLNNPPRLQARNNGILEIVNYENRPAWNPALNDNLFRGILEMQKVDGQLKIINELPLEDYLKGIAEISDGDPKEKIKTIIILARSYAKYYRDTARKFPGKPYDLDDDPDHTQKYVGYGLEKRSPNIVSAVKQTKGQIVIYKGKPVLTPYFNQSDGRTRSALEAWKMTDKPYLLSVPDTFCETTQLKGHGVGLSGCGATKQAKMGKTAEEIIKYYYTGVELTGEK